MPAIKALGIYAVEISHADRQCGIDGFQKKMIVVVHQAIGMTNPVVPLNDFPKNIEERSSVTIILENRHAGIAPRGDMVNSPRILDSKWSCH